MFPEKISLSSTYFAQGMLKIKRKEGIKDLYNYLIPSVQNTKIERMAYLKQRHYNQNTTNRKAKGQFFYQILVKHLSKQKIPTGTNMQKHTITEIVNHSRSTALERSEENLLRGVWGRGGGGGASIDITWPQPSPLVLPCYTQDICSVRLKGF